MPSGSFQKRHGMLSYHLLVCYGFLWCVGVSATEIGIHKLRAWSVLVVARGRFSVFQVSDPISRSEFDMCSMFNVVRLSDSSWVDAKISLLAMACRRKSTLWRLRWSLESTLRVPRNVETWNIYRNWKQDLRELQWLMSSKSKICLLEHVRDHGILAMFAKDTLLFQTINSMLALTCVTCMYSCWQIHVLYSSGFGTFTTHFL